MDTSIQQTDKEEFAERLKSVIPKKFPSVRSFALHIKAKPTSAQQWLDGRNYPRIDIIIKISEVFSVSLDWLLTGKEPLKEYKESNPEPNAVCETVAEYPVLKVKYESILRENVSLKQLVDSQAKTIKLLEKEG